MKYYQPELEEFHVGFEYEIFEDWDIQPEKTWHSQIYGSHGINPENMGYVSPNVLKDIRVKYLDEQDIKDLGFESVWSDIDTLTFAKDHIVITWWKDSTHIRINYTTGWQLFDGQLKNKNEFHKVLTQLGITI